MHSFDDISPKMEEYKARIKLAESEMTFVQTTERPLSLKLQPKWVILFVLAIFMVVCIRSAAKRQFEISWMTYVGVGIVLVAYVVYVVIMTIRNREFNKELSSTYKVKQAVYENLQAEKRSVFEEYVQATGGVKVELVDNNRACYIWYEDDELTIATLGDEIEAEGVSKDDVLYISTDQNLDQYNDALGADEGLDQAVPYSYLFTKNKSYIFTVESYSALLQLLPDKELQNKLKKS